MEARPKRVTFAQAPLQIIDGDRGKAYPSRQEFKTSGYCLFLNTGNVTKQGFDFSSCDYISEERDRLLRKGRLLRGDIVLTTRGTVGNVAFFDEHIEIERIRINSGMVIFRCDVAQLLPDYLFHFLRSRDFEEQVLSLVTGSAQPQLPIKDIQQIEIPIPSLADQERIVSIINSFEQRLISNRRSCRILEEMSQTLFKSWFVDFDPVVAKSEGRKPFGMSDETAALFPDSFEESELGAAPKGWRVAALSSDFKITMGQSPPGSSYNSDRDGTLFFQGRGEFGLRYPVPRLYTSQPSRIASAGDTLVTVRAPVGDINQATTDCCIGRGLASVQHKANLRSYTFYRFKNLRAEFEQFNGDGTLFGSVTGEGLRGIKHVEPSTTIQAAFEEIAAKLDSKVEGIHYENDLLKKTRDTLLPALLSGELELGLPESLVAEPTAA